MQMRIKKIGKYLKVSRVFFKIPLFNLSIYVIKKTKVARGVKSAPKI